MATKKIKIKKWVCSPHAIERLLERKITFDELTALISTPDHVDTQGPKFILSKNFKHRNDNMIAAVVIEKGKDNLWIVITVMVEFQRK